MSKNWGYYFLRSIKISALIFACIVMLLCGTSKAYESINEIGYGKSEKALMIKNGQLTFFGYKIL